MFEFKLQYIDPDFHKKGDPPYEFPPNGVISNIDSNLIEILGKNGTGKTTLLNVIALSMGYLEQDKDLESKPVLKEKLRRLNENPNLSYKFAITCDKPHLLDLRLERDKHKKVKIYYDKKPVDISKLKNFDIVFLTEDDPEKVINLTLGKINVFFDKMEKKLTSISSIILNNKIEIDSYKEYEKEKKELLQELNMRNGNLEKLTKDKKKLIKKFDEVNRKNEVENNLKLLNEELTIESEYKSLKNKLDKLKDNQYDELFDKLTKEESKYKRLKYKIDYVHNLNLKDKLKTLKYYKIDVDEDKILKGNIKELERITNELNTEESERNINKLNMVEGMIYLFSQFSKNDEVPIINKTVYDTLMELNDMKDKLNFDRAYKLLEDIQEEFYDKGKAVKRLKKIEDKITSLKTDIKFRDKGEYEKLKLSFMEKEKKYHELQVAQTNDKTKLLSEWNKLKKLKGTTDIISEEIRQKEINIGMEERYIAGCEHRIKVIQENMIKKPKYLGVSEKLEQFDDKIRILRENLSHWMEIVKNPDRAKNIYYKKIKQRGFGKNEYEGFIKAIGEFLGNQFEPFDFGGKSHFIKFFDIENKTFITKDDRKISVIDLSKGQNKIASLNASIKRLNKNRKGIVLIDEIADLDPDNLQNVKTMLKEAYNNGLIILAVLVRPLHEFTDVPVKILGW